MAQETVTGTPDLEALYAEIAAFELKSTEFLERRTEANEEIRSIEKHIRELQDGISTMSRDLGGDRRNLITLREKLLRDQLREEDMAVCSRASNDIEPFNHHHNQYEDTVWGGTDPLRKYGVFQLDEMTMVYSRKTNRIRRKEGLFDSFEMVTNSDFSILCPAHAPDSEKENHSQQSPYGEKYGPDEWTKVIEADGKFISELDGKEIPDGPRQGHLDSSLFGHFGYPEIS